MKTITFYSLILIALLLSACSSQPDVASAQEPATPPDQVINDFYAWYLERSAEGPKDVHDSVHLTADLVSRYDEARQSGGPGGGISFVCAQDFPDSITVGSASVDGSSATVLVDTSFGNTLELTLKIDGDAWKIDDIQCK